MSAGRLLTVGLGTPFSSKGFLVTLGLGTAGTPPAPTPDVVRGATGPGGAVAWPSRTGRKKKIAAQNKLTIQLAVEAARLILAKRRDPEQ